MDKELKWLIFVHLEELLIHKSTISRNYETIFYSQYLCKLIHKILSLLTFKMSTMHEKGLKKTPQILTEFQWTF